MTGELLPPGRPYANRGLTEQTTSKFGYTVGELRGRKVHIAPYRSADGTLVAQKLRDSEKNFSVVGDIGGAGLFGQHLWRDGGKRVVVTEGEIDAMSVSQAFGNTWPAVSVPSGAQAAKKAVQRSLEFLSRYEAVVFCFDMDEPGRKAAAECAALLAPGKAKIAELPAKDANELLKEGRVRELTTAIYEARTYRPGGVVNGAELWDRIATPRPPGIPYPWHGLTDVTSGQHFKRLVMWTAGTGMGKSTAVAQVAYELAFKHGLTIGYVALEEGVDEAGMRFMSHHAGKRLDFHGAATVEEMKAAFDATLGTQRVFLLDHFGSNDADDLIAKLRYLIVGCSCRVIVLDHISIAVSGGELANDERRTIDKLMTDLRTPVEETGVLLHAICHVKRADGKPAEEGGRVTLATLRGSGGIAQMSDQVIAIEGNQQAGGEEALLGTFRVLKNRINGKKGVAGVTRYNETTGALDEYDGQSDDDDSAGF